jgi:two-component system, chemotaxis family, chemotaxis protein CheY
MKTILVVEDLKQTRHLICEKLWSNGYHTLNAASVQEAYDVLSHETNQINLVLSDVDLADTTGFDLLKKIKGNPMLEDIPVVFWTSDYDSDKIRFARESGVARFIQKPFRDERLFTEIDRAIKTKGALISVVA